MIKEIRNLARMQNSASGNPRYRVTFTDGTVATTAPDSQVGYKIDNSEFRQCSVSIYLDRKGQIAEVRTV